MNRPIQVGDLVVVVRGGCADEFIGYVFSVARLLPLSSPCMNCHTTHGYPFGTPMAFELGETRGFELPRLKRIPPLSELESEKRDEEIEA